MRHAVYETVMDHPDLEHTIMDHAVTADEKMAALLERAVKSLGKPCTVPGSTGQGSAAQAKDMTANDTAALVAGWSNEASEEMNRLSQTLSSVAQAVRARKFEQQQFVATAAHDLRNPLFLITGAARILRDKDTPSEERDEWIDCILRNTTSLQFLVEDLNDGVKAWDGHFELRRDEVDLCQLTSEVVHDWGTVFKTHPVSMEGEGTCCVLGDRERLRRLLFNLLSNAVKYSEAGREVNVSVWRHGARICLKVQDDGTGIPTAKTERMFQPYTRLDPTLHMACGDGLGLASVKRIADAHGAEINVQGAPGRGTAVEVLFKVHDPLQGE
jgi:signal transduction histidine kinase